MSRIRIVKLIDISASCEILLFLNLSDIFSHKDISTISNSSDHPVQILRSMSVFFPAMISTVNRGDVPFPLSLSLSRARASALFASGDGILSRLSPPGKILFFSFSFSFSSRHQTAAGSGLDYFPRKGHYRLCRRNVTLECS